VGLVLFEWDEENIRMNCMKHGIGFEGTMHVFDAPTPWSSRTESKRLRVAGRRSRLAGGLAVLLIAPTQREGPDHSPRLGPAGQPEGGDAL
jgi:uncharacterized DUF497 family protein